MKNAKRLLACGTFILALLVGLVATPSAQSQTLTTLHSFREADGAIPQAGLVQAINGNLYGTTTYGRGGGPNFCMIVGAAAHGCGTVFKITPSGALTTLYSFCSQSGCTDGEVPLAGLVQGTDGNFYGTTEGGGANGQGTVFKITPSGTLTTLHSFNGITDGREPFLGGLIQAADGNFYGTTFYGGATDQGTVFKITPSGTLTTLHSFDGTDGFEPWAGLVQATDGNFYGTTGLGGAHNGGTVFMVTPTGTLTTLYSFCSQTGCTDGGEPFSGLVQASDGNFYGTTSTTVFKITPTGTLTTLYTFCAQIGCPDGDAPVGGLVQATDGNLYGTVQDGGANGYGTAFKITLSGALTTLLSFDGTDGSHPEAVLLQDTNGTLYGTTYGGGASSACTGGCGTVFSLSVGLGSFVEAQPTFGRVGKIVKILGTNLTGATSVSFNGAAATFTVVSSSLITTTLPAGATTGTVQVITPSGTLSSNVPFRVLP